MTGTMNSPINRSIPLLVALLTHPPITVIHDFLVAAVRVGTGRVPERFLLDESDSRLRGKVVGLVSHAELLVLCLTDGLQLGRSDYIVVGSGCHRIGIGLERFASAFTIVPVSAFSDIPYLWENGNAPSSESMGIGNVRVDRHGGAAEHGQRSTTEISHFDTLECDDGLVVVLEVLGRLAPQCQANTLARSVDQIDIPLCELLESANAGADGKQRGLTGLLVAFDVTEPSSCTSLTIPMTSGPLVFRTRHRQSATAHQSARPSADHPSPRCP